MEINDQKLEKILTDQRNEYQRYLGVLTESFESQVKLIAESTFGIQQQLVLIRDMVAKNTVDIEEIKMELHIVRGDVKIKVGRDEYNLLEERISKIEKVISHR
ncbi:MAG: hypothetical protein HY093_04725 [Candidatus Liptonbacteria bacterium]|nr:hypothetical protein [Candidatus Liptonbacteria bacterium]